MSSLHQDDTTLLLVVTIPATADDDQAIGMYTASACSGGMCAENACRVQAKLHFVGTAACKIAVVLTWSQMAAAAL